MSLAVLSLDILGLVMVTQLSDITQRMGTFRRSYFTLSFSKKAFMMVLDGK